MPAVPQMDLLQNRSLGMSVLGLNHSLVLLACERKPSFHGMPVVYDPALPPLIFSPAPYLNIPSIFQTVLTVAKKASRIYFSACDYSLIAARYLSKGNSE